MTQLGLLWIQIHNRNDERAPIVCVDLIWCFVWNDFLLKFIIFPSTSNKVNHGVLPPCRVPTKTISVCAMKTAIQTVLCRHFSASLCTQHIPPGLQNSYDFHFPCIRPPLHIKLPVCFSKTSTLYPWDVYLSSRQQTHTHNSHPHHLTCTPSFILLALFFPINPNPGHPAALHFWAAYLQTQRFPTSGSKQAFALIITEEG